MAVKFGGAKDYSAMQGPAPTGYHVPQSSEWEALCEILTSTFSMASNSTTMGTYLKMPMAGLRNNSSSNVGSVGSIGNYWSSTGYLSSGNTYAYFLYFTSSYLIPLNGYGRASGLSVRCFKDAPVVPDSSWTTLYNGSSIATGAGVFRKSSLGLISVSGDGATWYTIQDKNLGATTVYNQGDTVNDANCGYFFQWGNNYGFAHSGAVTTSSTKVNAGDYGPGNYYNSSTFITTSGYNRSSVRNDNLRGGVTGIRPGDLVAAYIGEYGWKPGANTLWYLNLNQSDASFTDAKSHTVNNNGVLYNANGVSEGCGYNATSGKRLYSDFNTGDSFPTSLTIMGFIKPTGNHYTNDHPIGISLANASTKVTFGIGFNQTNTQVQFNYLKEGVSWSTYTASTTILNTRHHYALTYNGTTMVGYIDGTQVISQNVSGSGSGTGPNAGLTVFGRNHPNYTNTIQGYVDEVIVENKVWTSSDLSDYLDRYTY